MWFNFTTLKIVSVTGVFSRLIYVMLSGIWVEQCVLL